MITQKILLPMACLLAHGLPCAEPEVSVPTTILDPDLTASWVRHGPHVSLGAMVFSGPSPMPLLRVGYAQGLFYNDQNQPRCILDIGVDMPMLISPYISVRAVHGRWTFGPEVGLITVACWPLGYCALARATYALGAPSTNGSGWFMSFGAGAMFGPGGLKYGIEPVGSVSIGYTF